MNSDSAQTPGQSPSPLGADTATALEGFERLTDTLEIDTSWEVNRRIYEAWRIYDPWPAGLLFHMAGPTGSGVRIQALWRNAKLEGEHMTSIGAERFTDVVAVLAGEFNVSPPDMQPINHHLRNVTVGPLVRHFLDIGPDLDESAGRQFGTVLTAVDFQHGAIKSDELDELWRRCGIGETVPEGLIMQFSWVEGDTINETQLWKSAELAHGFVEGVFGPERERMTTPESLAVTRFRTIKRLAVASGEFERALP